MTKFVECSACRQKLGSPILCDACRDTIARLQKKVNDLEEQRFALIREELDKAESTIRDLRRMMGI